MRPPGFWQNPRNAPGLAAQLLAPAAAIWAGRTAARLRQPPVFQPGIPVICVGNLTIGGTGKTPTVMTLVERLSGRVPHIVSRGYGGSLAGPLRVDETLHTAEDVGDEPLLLSAFAPTWVAKARAAAARKAEAAGAGIIIMDDGFQNPDILKTLNIVVVDAEASFGNGRVIPAGPLREPVKAGLARTDLLVTIGPPTAQNSLAENWAEIADLPRLEAQLKPLAMGMPWAGLRAFAFAGIGRPEKFFTTLRNAGAEVVETRAFDDHANFSQPILTRLLHDAKAANAKLVTTEKDAARLPSAFRREVLVLPVRLASDDWSPLDQALKKL